jgi:hypothetical protein
LGHVGGLITGAMMGLVLAEDENKGYKNYGIGILIIYFVTLLTLFYSLIEV